MMITSPAGFKKQAIIAVALLGFVAVTIGDARSLTAHLGTLCIAQAQTQSANSDEKQSPPEDTESKSKPDEAKEPSGIKDRPLKDFQPSEKIEAEQAVDFPYDI